MPIQTLAPNVFEVGASHADRKMFDAFMPTPMGTTYNSYLVKGETATALIDPVDPEKLDVLLANLEAADCDKLDYIVCLHTEQDHAGTLPDLLKLWPDAVVIVNKKVQELLETHVHVPTSRTTVVNEGETLDLGGKTLEFKMIPFAHWPDNYMAYLREDRILFSSDLFGSHYASQEVFSTDSNDQRMAARQYYAEIMMPFRKQVEKHVAWTREKNPKHIAPSHGPVWYDTTKILKLYESWVSDEVKKKVVIGYVSMHGSVERMVEKYALRLAHHGISVVTRNIAAYEDSLTVEVGHLASDVVDAAAIVIAAPTVVVGPHPAALYLAAVVNLLKPKARFLQFLGSFGWASQAPQVIEGAIPNYKGIQLEPLNIKGLPNDEDIEKIQAAADEMARQLSEDELVK